jgi:hypothetical protein
MRNALPILIFSLLLGFASVAQPITAEQRRALKRSEDSLKWSASKMVVGKTFPDRLTADSLFTRQLVRALKTPHSFYYPFDSIQQVSRLYAPDSSFRLFTWQLQVSENLVRQHGAIQMRTYDGSLRLYPLIDKSDVTINQEDTVANHLGWMGAIYYKIVQKRSSNVNYYTLLGYDEHNIRSTKKIIEVLSFVNDEPQFGGRFFSFENDQQFKSSRSRYIMEFKKDAGARLTYDPELDMIVMEHLVSETNEPNKKWTYIPDGDYEGFRWKNGKWVHVEKIFDQVTPEGQAPMPSPVKDAQGKTIESKLKSTEEQ